MFNLKQFFMQKKNLLGGALLLLCTLFVFTGCKEIMSNLDDPVSSYFELKENSTTVYLGQTYKIEYTTISDAKDKVTFEVIDNKNVASVDAKGVVTGLSKGTAKIKVTLPASDYYQGATKEFTVTVDALLGLKEGKTASVMLSKGEVYDLGVIAPEGSTPTYVPSNDNVAVDANGVVTAQKYGDATVTVSVTAYGRSESLKFDIKVRVQTETELNNIITAAAGGDGKVQVMLKDGFELENDLNLEGKKIELDLMNSILTFKGNQSFIISDNFTLKNAKIDASNSSVQLVKMTNNATVLGTVKKNGEVYTLAGKKDFYYIEKIIIDKVWVKNLKNDLITSQNITWAVDNFTIKNSIIQANYTGGSSSVIWLGSNNSNQGSIHNLDVDGNTFYNIDNKGTQRFISIGNSSNATKAWGTTAAGGDGTPATAGSRMFFKLNNNIFIKVGYNKFANNVPNSANNMFMEGNNNIFYGIAQIRQFFNSNNHKITTGNVVWGPEGAVDNDDLTRKDDENNPIVTKQDPGITVPTEPLDLVNGVVVK